MLTSDSSDRYGEIKAVEVETLALLKVLENTLPTPNMKKRLFDVFKIRGRNTVIHLSYTRTKIGEFILKIRKLVLFP